ncbi:Beta-eliminating lyase family protein [Desulfamplus magnetovallimortis]|uniref:Beta-eliminating lyase family protein n=1 Tax=Desulfamplus magnetovallimortis TaxID=1246637 RepID=A0A1W1HE12_9BACT|nr:DegT/DnrJ/EryC1/StrS family aminotransferase [Desulfamplus magnetovallimortis]SLM30719.1 Beta-eliminating lyase family protein [Desulfamplus magnetovallimortis]
MKIPLIKPYINENIKEEVLKVLESGYLTEGTVTKKFESTIQKYLEVKHVLAVCNCTVGLETALRSLNITSGDEIIIPDYTYPATASVVNIVGATAVIVDIDPQTMLIDKSAIENAITPRTKAIMPVSIFGNPLDYNSLNVIKNRYNLHIIEDAACSLGSEYNSVKTGNQADISVFSLHPRKFITTGEGGLITTNNDQLAQWMQSYKHFGMDIQELRSTATFEHIGTNYKMSNIQAAVGLGQMIHVNELLVRRRKLAAQYYDVFKKVDTIGIPKTLTNGRHSFQSCCIFVQNRNQIILKLAEKGIETQIGTYALHMHKAFYDNPRCRIVGDMDGSKYAYEHCLTLPMYHDMTENEQAEVIKEIKKLCVEYVE